MAVGPKGDEGGASDRRAEEVSFEQRFFYDRAHRAVLSLIDRGDDPRTILDVGCGSGRLLRRVGALYPSAMLIGVDPEEASLKAARRLMPSCTFYASPVESLPLADASVDLALSTFSFHHWPDQRKRMKQIARVLRPGGHLLLADLWPPFGLWTLTRHFWCSNPARVRDAFVRGGLKVLGQPRKMNRFLVVTIGERPD